MGRSRESWNEQADGTAEGKDRCTFIAFSDGFPVESPQYIETTKRRKRVKSCRFGYLPISEVAGSLGTSGNHSSME